MGGRGSGSSRGGGKAGGLDKNLINRANAASVMDMGDISIEHITEILKK